MPDEQLNPEGENTEKTTHSARARRAHPVTPTDGLEDGGAAHHKIISSRGDGESGGRPSGRSGGGHSKSHPDSWDRG